MFKGCVLYRGFSADIINDGKEMRFDSEYMCVQTGSVHEVVTRLRSRGFMEAEVEKTVDRLLSQYIQGVVIADSEAQIE